jgi:hypothetical protein
MTWQLFRTLLALTGFKFEDVWGTFASARDIKPEMSPAQQEVWGHVVDYYPPEVLACFFAPMFPKNARNSIWKLSRADDQEHAEMCKLFIPTNKIIGLDSKPSSSAAWPDDEKKIVKLVKSLTKDRR